MEELGDYYISYHFQVMTERLMHIGIGIEWYERAATCNNYEAGLKIGELTGKEFVYSDYLSFNVVASFILVVSFLSLGFWAARIQ